jgi:hypothetical protein
LVWPIAVALAAAIEPPPANPNAPDPAWASVLLTCLLVSWLATMVLAVGRQATTSRAALVTGLVAIALTVACPLTDHHHFGSWWFAQMALFGGPTLWAGWLTRQTPPLSRPSRLAGRALAVSVDADGRTVGAGSPGRHGAETNGGRQAEQAGAEPNGAEGADQ